MIDSELVPHATAVAAIIDGDLHVGMCIGIQRDVEGDPELAHVKCRTTDDNGRLLGQANNNLILDSRMYEVEYSSGEIKVLVANIIANQEHPVPG